MSANDWPQFTIGQTLLLGLRRRCPRCGIGDLFSSYLKVSDHCPQCQLALHGHDTGDGPVVPAILLLGAVIVAAALFFELTFAPPLWAHLVLWPPVILGLTLIILPPIKGIGIALQYKFRSTEELGKPGGS